MQHEQHQKNHLHFSASERIKHQRAASKQYVTFSNHIFRNYIPCSKPTLVNEISNLFLTQESQKEDGDFVKLCGLLRIYELYNPQFATQECISSQKNMISKKKSNDLSAFLLLKSRPFKFLPPFRRPIVGWCDGNFDLLHYVLSNEITIFNCDQ